MPRLPLPAIASVLSCTLTATLVPATLITLLLPGTALAQNGPGAPNVYAITNARIVPVSGPVIPKGTIVLRDGLIAALGAGVAAPPDAQVIDGPGLTVYPALVNGYGRVGMPSPSEYPAPRGDVYPVSTIRAENNAPALLKPDAPAALALRRVGFATSLSAPYVGILSGTSAVVSLADAADPSTLVLRPSAFMHADFSASDAPGGGQYPGSLMGEIAATRQAFYDAQTAATVGDAFEKDPRGRTRPVTPRALLALRPVVVEKKQTLALHADSAQAIRRALKVAREFGLRPVIEGATEAWAVTGELKAANASVLLSANLPAAPRLTPGEEDPSTLQGLRERALAPTSAAALTKAGIPFAITAGGMTTVADFTRNVRRMIAAGLPVSAALEATTSAPARLLGVERQVGTLEPGKVADILVTKGDLFADKTRISYLFVDGKKQEVEPERAAAAAQTSVAGAPEAAGDAITRATSIAAALPPGVTAEQALLFLRADPASAAPFLPPGMTAEQAIKELETLIAEKAAPPKPAVAAPPAATPPVVAAPVAQPAAGRRPGGARAGGAAAPDPDAVTAPPKVGTGLVPPLPPALPTAFVLRDADMVWTSGPRGNVPNADVYVKDGKIAAVGQGLKVPTGTREIDAKGKQITPGMIDCHSHTAIEGGVNEGSNIVTAECRIVDVIDAEDVNIYRQLAGGTTAANLLHGSANAIGGQNAVVKWRWGKTADQMLIAGAPQGIKFALGENPKQSNFRNPTRPLRYPSTRMGVERVIRETFLKARDYKGQWSLYKGGKRPAPPRRDLQMEAMVEILDGKRLVHSHSYRSDEILMLTRLAEEFGFTIATFQHVLEGYKVADELAKHGAGASTFSDWWAFKIEAWDAIPYNGALMTERGVNVSFNSDDSELARHMNLEAAKAVHWGDVDPVEALKFVTINPAKQLHIDKMTGSLETGKDADIVVWSGSPLSTASLCEKTIVDGALYFDRAADIAARPALQAEKTRLASAEKRTAPPAPSGGALPVGVNVPLNRVSSAGSSASGGTASGAAKPSEALPPAGQAISSPSPLTAIVNGTVHPVSGPEIANGIVLMQNGRITAVGAAGSVTVPDGATRVDATGLHVYPGMIDANTGGLGISEIGSLTATQDGRELGDFSPELRAAIAVNPDSELIRVARANGILAGVTAPTGGTFSGMGALLQLDGWTSEELALNPSVGLYVNYPSTGGRRFRETSHRCEETAGSTGEAEFDDPAIQSLADVPATSRDTDALKYGQLPDTAQGQAAPTPVPVAPLAGQGRGQRPSAPAVPGAPTAAVTPDPEAALKPLNDFLDEARRYQRSRQAEGKGTAIAAHDPRLEAMGPVLNGTIPVFIRASREKDIRSAVAWGKKNGLRTVIVGGSEADKAADLLVKENVPVILGEVLALPSRFDTSYDDPYTLPARLAKAGVRFCLSTGAPSDVRRLPYHAAMASAFGLPADEALKAITLYPAQILGAGSRLGSLEAGKDATLLLTTGNPLEITSVVKAAYCQGLPVDLGNKQLRLYEKYKSRPRKP